MRRPRLRSALLVAAVLTAGVPTVVLADAPALHCRGIKQSGSWETIRVAPFKPVASVASSDSVSAWTVDESRPQDLLATNGVRVLATTDHGCDWADSLALSFGPGGGQTFAGANAKIVSLALLGTTHVAAVQEGTGAASRPHIMVGTGSSWTTADSGLPAQGAPKLLRAANDGRTLYLTISPTGSGGEGGSTGLPGGLPVGGSGGVSSQTGLLYASTDRGHTWTLRTTANDLPAGGTGFSALDIDASDSNRLYGIVGGVLAVSRDGGGSFQTTAENGFTALTAMSPLTVVAFRSSGLAYYSANGGANFTSYKAPAGVTSAGFRQGDQTLMIERSGLLQRLSLFSQQTFNTPAGAEPRTGSLTGDRGAQASFHALAGHSLLRYVDPLGKDVVIPPIAAGDTSVPPPVPGTVVPAAQSVTLPVGTAGTAPFTLDLPKNPTPLDLFFLVDSSGSMVDYIDNLKANINRIVAALRAQHIDLAVGVGTLGSGPREGEQGYPATYVYPTDPTRRYNRPVIYRLLRPVGKPGSDLTKAVNNITIESDDIPSTAGGGGHEGQLLALSQAVRGDGIRNPSGLGWAVPPGQDAHWRPRQDVRRILVLATDEAFDDPVPQTHTADDRPIFTPAIRDLNNARVQVIGMSGGDTDSLPDLRQVAQGTRSFAPPGGVYCGIDPSTDLPENIAPGQPLVCNSGDHFADAIIRLLSSLVDRQSVKLVPLAKSQVLGALQGSALLGLNVKKPNAAPFTVNVSCVGVKPGRYGGDVAAVLRGTQVGKAHVQVTCVKALAAAPPRPLPPVGNPPAAPPQPAPPPAIPPPPPAPAPQVQIQTQVQVNPMTAGAIQEQQELQLALALNGTLKDDDPAFNPGLADMAMVDRRKREQVQAMYLLAFAMTTCAGLGLARLRAKPELHVRRAS